MDSSNACPLIGASLDPIRVELERLARSSQPVLIQGPSGAGKGIAARWLHDLSHPNAPFVTLNCASVVETLVESELFGHERGAFTGAVAKKDGLFEAAGNGTLFLDEIGDMPLGTQAKLLRAIDERVARRVGGTAEYAIAARVVAATHVDLELAVSARQFREDLFHRLGFRVFIPGLEERPADIREIASALVRRLERPLVLDDGALDWLELQRWPGNVRELRYFLERVALQMDGLPANAASLHAFKHGSGPVKIRPLAEVRREVEAQYTLKALAMFEGNVSATAQALGIGRSTVIRHRNQHARKK